MGEWGVADKTGIQVAKRRYAAVAIDCSPVRASTETFRLRFSCCSWRPPEGTGLPTKSKRKRTVWNLRGKAVYLPPIVSAVLKRLSILFATQ